MKKRRTHPQSSRPEFAMTGLVAGGCAGMAIGLIVEMVLRRGMVVMQAGGVAGIALGALIESVRFWWRKHVFRLSHKEAKPPATLRR